MDHAARICPQPSMNYRFLMPGNENDALKNHVLKIPHSIWMAKLVSPHAKVPFLMKTIYFFLQDIRPLINRKPFNYSVIFPSWFLWNLTLLRNGKTTYVIIQVHLITISTVWYMHLVVNDNSWEVFFEIWHFLYKSIFCSIPFLADVASSTNWQQTLVKMNLYYTCQICTKFRIKFLISF